MTDGDYEVVETRYGFEWGPLTVERITDDYRFGVFICVSGKREKVDIRVTPSGLVRVGEVEKIERRETW